jgi:hypothetical protein
MPQFGQALAALSGCDIVRVIVVDMRFALVVVVF